MTEQQNIDDSAELLEVKIDSRYIDPKTDFAFKRLAEQGINQDALLKFLDIVYREVISH